MAAPQAERVELRRSVRNLEEKNWGGSRGSKLLNSPQPRLTVTQPFSSYNWFTDKEFLTREYIEKEKSLSLIAHEIGCARSTVIEHLLKHGIELRTDGLLPHYKKSQLAYGERIYGGKVVPHLGEMNVIARFQELRRRGMSFGKIANWANEQLIPTKNRASKWNRRTIFEILRRNERSDCP